MPYLLCLVLLSIIGVPGAEAHSIEYQVENRGISARFFYPPDDPARYSAYEIFGPGDKIPHQKGRTDRNGVLSFLPDRPGKWEVKVIGESDHGPHAADIEINVNESLLSDSFTKPLVAACPKFFTGAGIFMTMFGVWALLTARRERGKGCPNDGQRQ